MNNKAFIFSVIAASIYTADCTAAERVGAIAHLGSEVANAIGAHPIPTGVAIGSVAGAYILGGPGGTAVGAVGGALHGVATMGGPVGAGITGMCNALGNGIHLPQALVSGAASVAGAGATSAALGVVSTALTSSAPRALVIGAAATAATGRGLYALFLDQLIAPGRIAEAVKLGAQRAATAAFFAAIVSVAGRTHAAYSGTHYLGR